MLMTTTMDRLGEKMPFLFEIVANGRNGLDVDKCVRSLVLCAVLG